MRFCGGCGRSLGAAADDYEVVKSYLRVSSLHRIVAGTAARPSGLALPGTTQRAHVTVLAMVIRGWAALAGTIGRESVYSVLEEVEEAIYGAVETHAGSVQELNPDGALAVFGAPVALENSASNAVLAAMRIKAEIVDLRAKFATQGLDISIALHSGTVILGQITVGSTASLNAIGEAITTAKRLREQAAPEAIVISEATRVRLEGSAETRPVGPCEVGGQTVDVHELLALDTVPRRFNTAVARGLGRIAGRTLEIETLLATFGRARPDTASVVTIFGEPGIGKTRLVYEFHQRLGDTVRFLEGNGTQHTRTVSFGPFVEMIRGLAGLTHNDDDGARIAKLRAVLQGADVESGLSLLCNLLGVPHDGDDLRGLDGAIIGTRTRKLFRAIFQALARTSPLVIFVDDIQWIDRVSMALIQELFDEGAPSPILWLFASRADYRPPWMARPGSVAMHLEPLTREATIELLRDRLGDDADGGVIDILAGKADGNPLFAEELARFIREGGRANDVSSVAGSGVPAVLQELFAPRLERLSPDARAVLEAASVVGRGCHQSVLRDMASDEEEGGFLERLHELEAAEMIALEPGTQETVWTFSHSLFQQTVYETLVKGRREALHAAAAESIERVFAHRLQDWAEALGYQWEHAGRPDRAAPYLERAAAKSLRLYAIDEAGDHYRELFALVEAFPGCLPEAAFADAVLGSARVHYYRKDFRGLISLVSSHLAAVEAAGDQRRLSLLLFWLGFAHAMGARFEEARPLLRRALRLGESLADEECVGYALMGLLWIAAFARPESQDVVEHLADRVLVLSEKHHDVYLMSKTLFALTLYRITRGRNGVARVSAERLLALGQEAQDARTRAMGLHALAFVDFSDERYDDAIRRAEESRRISPDPLDQLLADAARGMALALAGRGEEGLRVLNDVRQQLIAGDLLALLLATEIPHGAAMVVTGQLRQGVRWIQAATERFEAWGNEAVPAFGHLILGELYVQLTLGDAKVGIGAILRNLLFVIPMLPRARSHAIEHLTRAIDLARTNDIPLVLARALFDVALLTSSKGGRVDPARQQLAEARDLARSINATKLLGRIEALQAQLASR
jgi:class 3 adenylate cyclase/tetratricopeptide (TPR) repeat protein